MRTGLSCARRRQVLICTRAPDTQLTCGSAWTQNNQWPKHLIRLNKPRLSTALSPRFVDKEFFGLIGSEVGIFPMDQALYEASLPLDGLIRCSERSADCKVVSLPVTSSILFHRGIDSATQRSARPQCFISRACAASRHCAHRETSSLSRGCVPSSCFCTTLRPRS